MSNCYVFIGLHLILYNRVRIARRPEEHCVVTRLWRHLLNSGSSEYYHCGFKNVGLERLCRSSKNVRKILCYVFPRPRRIPIQMPITPLYHAEYTEVCNFQETGSFADVLSVFVTLLISVMSHEAELNCSWIESCRKAFVS